MEPYNNRKALLKVCLKLYKFQACTLFLEVFQFVYIFDISFVLYSFYDKINLHVDYLLKDLWR